jgi:hypothetical protein
MEQQWRTPCPYLSVFLPAPVNIHLTTNTFIKFGILEKVGLIVDINSSEWQCTLRHFLSIQQLQEKVGNHLPQNIICWPQQSIYPLVYLLDSDIMSVVPFSEVVGLAFVFHEDDALVAQLRGMANTYVSSSCFSSQTFTITHGHKFHSFPSTASKLFHLVFRLHFPATSQGKI